MLMKLSRYGNSFGQSERARTKWTQDLGFTIKDARKEPVQYLWFVGDYASFDPRLQEVTRLTAKIFHAAQLDFGILYDGERNSGNDVRRIGEEGLYQLLSEKNRTAIGKATFETIVTTDPHSYNTLKNEYRMNGHTAKVVHSTELFYQLLRTGRLTVRRRLSEHITYHDPCYLGRYNGVYEPPRLLLQALGLQIEEMPRNRSKGFCCGAGGGRIWMEDSPGIKERPSENRIREALSLHGIDSMAVACPKDIVMFRDAIKTTGNEQRLVIKDVAEYVGEALEIQKGI
jgi:Fe-S oxidoreductase